MDSTLSTTQETKVMLVPIVLFLFVVDSCFLCFMLLFLLMLILLFHVVVDVGLLM